MLLRVLVVDDSPLITAKIVDLLLADGYQCATAGCAAEALEEVGKFLPDLILLDLMLPDMDGIELLKILKSKPGICNIPVIMVTACDSDIALSEALHEGAVDFITKPFTDIAVKARARAALKTYRLQQELQQAKEAAELLARRDSLTGLFNRRTFFERFEQEWSRSCRYQTSLSCIMFDIDNFKSINDTHGHIVGDSVLVAVSRILRENCRDADSVCRFGGEEFCMLLPETDLAGAASIAERICSAIAERLVVVGDETISFTISLGVAQRDASHETVTRLVEFADLALLKSKQTGRNRVTLSPAAEDIPLVASSNSF